MTPHLLALSRDHADVTNILLEVKECAYELTYFFIHFCSPLYMPDMCF